jgi:putative transposase
VAEHGLSIRRACRALRIGRSTFYKKPTREIDDDRLVVDALNAVVEAKPRWGFWKCFGRLRLNGHRWNHKRVWRVYCDLRLNIPRRTKKRVPKRVRQPLEIEMVPNAVWAVDFMSDALYRSTRFRTLNVLDEGVREALDIVADTSIPATRLVRTLDELRQVRGAPGAIRCDNGPELIAQAFVDWCEAHGIEILYIQPGKPDQNAYIERFNRSYREEVLNAYIFETLEEVRAMTRDWLWSYNEERPHDALGRIPPAVFRRRCTPNEMKVSTFEWST